MTPAMPEQSSSQPPATHPARALLAFDYGEQRIGVAVGNRLTATAQALTTLSGGQAGIDWPGIETLIADWQPDALIVGLPRHEDGTEHALSARARRFARQLEGRHHLPVFMVDEHLSSWQARQSLKAQRQSGRRRIQRTRIDAVAAQHILESFMEAHPRHDPD